MRGRRARARGGGDGESSSSSQEARRGWSFPAAVLERRTGPLGESPPGAGCRGEGMDSSEGRMRPIALSPRSARASVSDARRRCRPAGALARRRRRDEEDVGSSTARDGLVRGVCAPRESREGARDGGRIVAARVDERAGAPRGGRHGDPLPRSVVEWAAPFCSSKKTLLLMRAAVHGVEALRVARASSLNEIVTRKPFS